MNHAWSWTSSDTARAAFGHAYATLTHGRAALKIMLTTYFGGSATICDTALALPVHGLHVDLVRAPEQLDAVVAGARPDLVLSLGVIDGRNVWRTDLNAILDRVEPVVASGRAGRARALLLAAAHADRSGAGDEP